MRKPYASDISREKFEEILPLLQSVRKRTKPSTVDLYEVFCAVLLRCTVNSGHSCFKPPVVVC